MDAEMKKHFRRKVAEEMINERNPDPPNYGHNLLEIVTSCEGCGGACCRNMGMPPFDPIWVKGGEHAPKKYRKALDRAKKEGRWTKEMPCIWLTPDGKCKHYEDRPSICRDFVAGSDSCLDQRAAHRAWIQERESLLNG